MTEMAIESHPEIGFLPPLVLRDTPPVQHSTGSDDVRNPLAVGDGTDNVLNLLPNAMKMDD
jgi:hypothetical protein